MTAYDRESEATTTRAGWRSDELVARPALERRLARLAPVTVVQAPAGHGKTTLVRAWAGQQRARGDLVVWWDVAPDLDRPAVVRRSLAEALGGSTEGTVVLVVDGAHHLGPSACDILCETVVAHPRLHLVACADGPQHLTAHAPRHRLETSVVGWAELTVTAAELRSFARAWGHDLTADEAADLHAHVGGWLHPARLVLEAADRSPGSWRLEPAEALVRREVLPVLARWVDLDALGRLALGPHVTHQLVAELWGGRAEDQPASLSALAGMGVLERLPADGRADRWHLPVLLRRVLRQERERAGHDDSRWHAAVARTLEREAGSDRERGADELADVLHHARLGEDWQLLADLWRRCAVRMITELPAATADAFAALPKAVVRRVPVLGLPGTMADALVSRAAGVDGTTALQALAAASRRALAAGALPKDPAARSIAVAAALRGLRAEGRLDDALRLGAAHDRERAGRRAGSPAEPGAWFLLTWGSTIARTSMVGAVDVTTRAFEAAASDEDPAISAHAAALLALLHTLLGATREGRRWLDVTETTGIETPVAARLCRAALALDQLDVDTADLQLAGLASPAAGEDAWPFVVPVIARRAVLSGLERATMDRLDELAHAHASPGREGGLATQLLDRARADLLLALGEVDRARTFLDQRSADAPWLRVPLARLATMTGDHERAARLASSGVWEAGVATRDTAELLMIAAGAHDALGDEAGALEAFERGRVLAAGVDSLLPYVGIAATVRDRLADLSGTPLEPGFRAALARVAAPYAAVAEVVPLSPREREVLGLMATHPTAADVARSLTVSVNTVKKQQGSIYAKLGVHGRTSALARARAIGLLPDETSPGGD